MNVIALTGGIGSGKSEVARQFALLGVPIVDTDVISHTLTAVGSPTLMAINQQLNDDFLNADGSLNRAKLRERVFNQPADRLKLEGLLHPLIRAHALKQLSENAQQLKPHYQILVIPLLFENHQYADIIQQILVVDCDESLQITRAMARSQLTKEQVKAIMAAQTTRAQRLAMADEVIENNGTREALAAKVIKMHEKICKKVQ